MPHHRHLGLTVAILAVAASAFWFIFWNQSSASALTRVPILDEAWYLQEAIRLRAEGWPGQRPFVMSPGYASLVALTAAPSLGVDGVLAAPPSLLVLLQALAWGGCGLVAGCVVWRSGRAVAVSSGLRIAAAVLAALLPLLYASTAVYARTVLLDLPLSLLVAGTLALLTSGRARLVGRFALAGLLLGLAAALRAHVLVLAPLIAVVVWRAAASTPRRTAAAGLALLLAILPIAFAAAHNTRVAARPTGPSLNAGLNLYLGLVPDSGGLFTVLEGFHQQDDPSGEQFLEARLGRQLDGPAAADRAWLHEALSLIRADPGQALTVWLRKIWLHWQGWEMAQVTPLAWWPREVPILRALPVTWRLLAILGLSGFALVLLGRRGQPAIFSASVIWLLATAILIAVQSLFFVVSRYRLILVVPLAVATGLGVLMLFAAARSGGWRSVGRWWPVPLVALIVTQPWGLGEIRREWTGLEAYNLARRTVVLAGHEQDSELRERAEILLAETCEVIPRRANLWRDRALNLAALGRHHEALNVLARGTVMATQPAALEILRVQLVRESGRLDQAEALAVRYLRDHPDDRDMWHDLAVLQGERNRWAAAAVTARRLQAIAPADARGWLDEAVALARQGRPQEGIARLEAGLEQVADESGLALLKANLTGLRGRIAGP